MGKVFKILLLLFLLFAIVSLSSNTVNLVNRGLVVRKEKQDLEALRESNEQLRAQLDYVKTEQFLEQEARNSLGLTKDETVLILPEDIFGIEKVTADSKDWLPPWRQWWELFFRGIIF
ncbi:MAG: septum formation initiator family protein [Candidatus Shapirobacteria bacterium]|nr:septum formation initiator family protein [Candidatus Shapirobacteria bacterium]MDD5073642.1 septum formation initiator family protein [Candidatus Shapirobacteria bacterium]MDD5481397.1 septum formation initiator family protein [Candidatus Shapirobacteria bacterium]